MTAQSVDPAAVGALDALLRMHLALRSGDAVLVTSDDGSDAELLRLLQDRIVAADAVPSVLRLDRLPLQGLLADPFIPASVAGAAGASDVWIDLTFPYLAGSTPFNRAMENARTRYLLIGDAGLESIRRLYDESLYDALFDLQEEVDRRLRDAEGQPCRIVTPLGTDLELTIGRPATRKLRRATSPGAQTVPGSAIFYPRVETVRGTIALEAAFHERYERLPDPLVLEVDGRIRRVGEGRQRAALERALLRAGGGEFGHVIHLTIGLHPQAIDSGRSFIEDIRALGRNAVGLGLPWWMPGGGENHPDGIVRDQSVWIAGEPLWLEGHPPPASRIEALLEAVRSKGLDAASRAVHERSIA